MASQYIEAGHIIDQLVRSKNASLRNLLYNTTRKRVTKVKQLKALVTETLKCMDI